MIFFYDFYNGLKDDSVHSWKQKQRIIFIINNPMLYIVDS